MPTVEELIAELRKEIEVDKKALATKEAALQFLERQGNKPESRIVPDQKTAENEAVFHLDELVPGAGKKTLAEEATEVIKRFGTQEFTVAHVEAAMNKMGVKLDGKSPRARISVALGKLEETGLLVKTFEGKGNVPNRYKVKEIGSDLV